MQVLVWSVKNIEYIKDKIFYTVYVSWEIIIFQIDDYAVQLGKLYPEFVSVETIGLSHEKRPLRAVKISTNPPVGSTKPIIFIDAGNFYWTN